MKKLHGIVESIILIIFGLSVMIASLLMDYNGVAALSPALFPLILGILIIILATVLLANNLKSKKNIQNCNTESPNMKSAAKNEKIDSLKTILLIIICIIYIIMLKFTGFIVATIFIIGAINVLLGERKWWKILLLSVIGSLVIYLAFDIGLQVHLP